MRTTTTHTCMRARAHTRGHQVTAPVGHGMVPAAMWWWRGGAGAQGLQIQSTSQNETKTPILTPFPGQGLPNATPVKTAPPRV